MQEHNNISQYDRMTKTPVSRLVSRLAVPTVISMLVSTLYNVADTAFVGRLGTSASGAVGVVFGFMSIIQAIGFCFGQGGGSLISRAMGKKDTEEVNVTFSTAITTGFAVALITEILCFIFLDDLVMLLGSTETIAPYAKSYVFWILLAAPFQVCSFIMNNTLRFEGKALYGMIGLGTGALINIVGDPILMFGFDMGIAGAGCATAASQIISFCILAYMLYSGKSACRYSLKDVRPEFGRLWEIVGTGLPSMIRQGLAAFSTLMLNTEARVYGDAAVAAMGIVGKVGFFMMAIALGIGQGFQPVCAFNYGAGKYKRVRDANHFAFSLMQVVETVGCIAVFFLAAPVVRLFRDDPEVIDFGTRALQLLCMAMLVQPYAVITEMTLQSTGMKLQASILSSLKSGVVFIPLLLFLARTRGMAGIQEAQPIAHVISFIPAVIFSASFFKKMPGEDRQETGGGEPKP